MGDGFDLGQALQQGATNFQQGVESIAQYAPQFAGELFQSAGQQIVNLRGALIASNPNIAAGAANPNPAAGVIQVATGAGQDVGQVYGTALGIAGAGLGATLGTTAAVAGPGVGTGVKTATGGVAVGAGEAVNAAVGGGPPVTAPGVGPGGVLGAPFAGISAALGSSNGTLVVIAAFAILLLLLFVR